MKKSTNKFLSVLLTLAMVLTMLPAFTVTASAGGSYSITYLDPESAMGSTTSAIPVSNIIATDSDISVTWNAGTYVVGKDYNGDGKIDATDATYADEHSLSKSFTISNTVVVSGGVKLILADGFTLTVSPEAIGANAITVSDGALTIYAQSTGSAVGKLIAKGADNASGSGGSGIRESAVDSTISICGGKVTANGGDSTSGNDQHSGGYGIAVSKIIIIDGNVTATGGDAESGQSGMCGNSSVSISGGTVSAHGGKGQGPSGGMGIIGFTLGITISGGNVTATGGEGALFGGYGIQSNYDITISGGTVAATGGKGNSDGGYGIACNTTVSISGGTVTANGGEGSTGGCGIYGDNTVSISGGNVTATGGTGTTNHGGIYTNKLFASDALIVKAGTDSASETITHTSTQNIATDTNLQGKQYVKICAPETKSLTVTTLDDVVDNYDGKISLREAIKYAAERTTSTASGHTGEYYIDFDYATLGDTFTIALVKANGALTVDASDKFTAENPLTIAADTGKSVTISGGYDSTVADSGVQIMTVAAINNVVLSNLTFTKGYADDYGGAIINSGTLTINNSTFTENTTTKYGGAIINRGTLTVNNNMFTGNTATDGGGAIINHGTLTINGGSFTGNTATKKGGAIRSTGTLTINGGSFTGNTANYGGAIYPSGGSYILNSTFTGNTANASGQAIYVDVGSLNLVNNIIVGNGSAAGVAKSNGTIYGYGINIVDESSVNNITFTKDSGNIGKPNSGKGYEVADIFEIDDETGKAAVDADGKVTIKVAQAAYGCAVYTSKEDDYTNITTVWTDGSGKSHTTVVAGTETTAYKINLSNNNINYAGYGNLESFDVTFDSNGGSNVSTQRVVSGNNATEPAAPTRNDFNFNGWYGADGKLFDFDKNVITTNTALTAKWLAKNNENAISIASGTDIQVKGENIQVGGLEELAKALKATGTDIKVEIEVKSNTKTSGTAIDAIKNETGNTGKKLQFFDIDLRRYDGAVATPTDITDTASNLIEIIIPFDESGKKNTEAYRYHSSAVEKFAKKSTLAECTTDKTFYVENEGTSTALIHLFSTKFSTYAISFTEDVQLYSGPSSYSVTVKAAENGSVKTNSTSATEGSTVTFTVTPDEGYELESVTVVDSTGKEVAATKLADGKYSFTMPGHAVTVSAKFAKKATKCAQDASCILSQFTDVVIDAWYHDGVHFCVENKYMTGYDDTTFGPTDTLSRGMIVQMLYNMEGRPAVAEKSSYTDVAEGKWYADAIAWAEDNAVVDGYGNGTFGPEDNITREQLAKIFYSYAKLKGYSVNASEALDSFTDAAKASTWAVDSLKWAKAVKLINGKEDGSILDPTGLASRAEAATILYNFCSSVVK